MSTTQKNPYIGPRTFQKDEGHLFFGREREARDLIALVASERLVLFYAQSGAGKSSIVNTRLIPNLDSKDYQVLPVGRVGGDTVANAKVDNIFVYNLIRGLVQQKADDKNLEQLTLTQFLTGLDADDNGYFYSSDGAEVFDEPLEEGTTVMRRALIIDQFEELLSTHPEAWEKRDDFFAQLAQAMEDDPYLWVVLVMREDYIAMLDPYAHHVPSGLRVRYYMQRLGREAALVAVKSPVQDVRPYEEGVAEKLVDDLCSIKIQKPDGTPGEEPGQYVEPVQLQVVCYGLWGNLSPDGKQITQQDLRDVGDVNQSLGNHYESRVAEVAKAKKVKERLIREWFEKKLITEGGIRNLVLQDITNKSDGLDDDVIQALQSDLVRAEKRGGATWYELTHDRLVDPILERNKIWFNENLSPLQRQAALWKDQNQQESWLLRDNALIEMEVWAGVHKDELTDIEIEFLEACRKLQKQILERKAIEREQLEMANKLAEEQARSAKRARLFNIVAGVLIVVAVVATIFSISAARDAEVERKAAENAKAIADLSAQNAQKEKKNADKLFAYSVANDLTRKVLEGNVNFDQALLLSVQAYNKSPENPLAQTTLVQNFQKLQRLKLIFSSPEDSVGDLLLSPDGSFLALWGDTELTIWSQRTGDYQSFPLAGADKKVYFSPDSKMLLVVDQFGINRWSLSETTVEFLSGESINFHDGSISRLVPSVDGTFFISQGEDDSLVRWNTATDERTEINVNQENQFLFSPTGEFLAGFDEEGNITLQSINESGKVLASFQGQHPTFSPDGSILAVVNIDQSITIQKIEEEISSFDILPQMEDDIHLLVFNDTGKYLAISDDAITQIWDIKKDAAIGKLINGGPLMFSPDGKLLVVFTYEPASGIYSEALYCVGTNQRLSTPPGETYYGFSPDGKTLAVRTPDGISLRTVSENCEISSEKSVVFQANPILFNPRAGTLASVESDGSVLLRDATTGSPLGDPIYEPDTADSSDFETAGEPSGLQFSTEGKLFVFQVNNQLYVWDLDGDPTVVPVPDGFQPDSITTLEFASDNILLVGRKNGKITKWDIASGKLVDLESNARGRIDQIIFDPKSNLALSIGQYSLTLVDLVSGEKRGEAMDGSYLDVNWETNLLATLTDEGIAVWELDTGKLKNKNAAIEGIFARFTKDGEHVLTGTGIGFTLYDAKTLKPIGEELLEDIEDLENTPAISSIINEVGNDYRFEWSPNGKIFALASLGYRVQMFEVDPGNANAPIEFLGYSIYSYGGLMAFSENSNYFYFNETSSCWIDVLNLQTDPGQWSTDRCVSGQIPIHLDATTLALGIQNEGDPDLPLTSVWLWDMENYLPGTYPEKITSSTVDLKGQVKPLKYDIRADGRELVVLGSDENIYIWDLETEPKVVGGVYGDAENPVNAAAISPDGTKQATFTGDGIVISKPTDNSLPDQTFNEHILKIDRVIFNPAGSIIAASGDREQTYFYNVDSGTKIGDLVDGAFEQVGDGGHFWKTVSSDKTASIWNSSTGKLVIEISESDSVYSSPDGNFIAIQDAQGVITLWDADGNKIGDDPINGAFGGFSSFEGRTYMAINVSDNNADSPVRSIRKISSDGKAFEPVDIPGEFVSFTSNGRYVAMREDELTKIWDLATGTSTFELEDSSVTFSPNSDLAIYQSENRIFLKDIASGRVIVQANGEYSEFSSDGLVVFIYDGNADRSTLLDTVAGKQLARFDGGGFLVQDQAENTPYVFYSYFISGFYLVSPAKGILNPDDPIPGGDFYPSSNGKYLIHISYDEIGQSIVKLWDRMTGTVLGEGVNLSGWEGFSPDGNILLIRNSDDSVTLLDAADPTLTIGEIEADRILFMRDYEYAVAINKDDNSLTLYDINNPGVNIGKIVPSVDVDSINAAVMNDDGETLALYGSQGIVLWDVGTREQIVSGALQEKAGTVTKMLFNMDNSYLASLGHDGIVVTDLDNASGPASKVFIPGGIKDMNFSAADHIIYLTNEYDIYEVDISTVSGIELPLASPIRNPDKVCNADLSDDGRKVAFLISNKVVVWDRNESTYGIPEPIDQTINSYCASALAFSPDGSTLAISDGSQIYLWDTVGNTLRGKLNGNSVFPTSASLHFSFIDSQTMAVSAYNPETDVSTISLWDILNKSKKDFTIEGSLSGLTSNASILLYRDNEQRVILQDQNPEDLSRFALMRDIMCEIVGRNFTRTEWADFLPDEPYPVNRETATCPNWSIEPIQ